MTTLNCLQKVQFGTEPLLDCQCEKYSRAKYKQVNVWEKGKNAMSNISPEIYWADERGSG